MSKSRSATTRTRALRRLECRLKRDLETLAYPARPWVHSRALPGGGNVLDALIVGGGQSGLAIAFGLMREKVTNLLVVDRNAIGREGPWRKFARMATLRTPKHMIGPDQGIISLTFRAWYQALHGESGWKQLGNIPTEVWADYLSWYRDVLALPVQNDTELGAITFDDKSQCFAVPARGKDGGTMLHARKIVLATGIDGSGRWETPEYIRTLPRNLWAHTSEDIDFASLKGKRVGVLGAGASAFDNAICALKAGATNVDLCFRRPKLPNVNPFRCQEYVGFLKHHADLTDELKWQFVLQIMRMGQVPPKSTYLAATAFDNFHLHPETTWVAAEAKGEVIVVDTVKGKREYDFLIIGTGFITDLSKRTELASIAHNIALWKDRYSPKAGDEHEDLSRHPYLGENFEFTERVPGQAPYLNSIFSFTLACFPSLGFGGASIAGMKYSLPRVIAGVTKQLYLEDATRYLGTLRCFNQEEY
ncbi:MAG: NAD(P)/FAD-dependent oxidoreductase [Candidatus Obscuribacterales bacterium]|nr:NAD(P)/FAD-dependent oxidoreductase [Candidatus Obscuribacterales bacterium]